MTDRYLRALVPMVAERARLEPHPWLDELLSDLSTVCARRGLRSILAEAERVADGGAVAPLPVVDVKPDRADATSSG